LAAKINFETEAFSNLPVPRLELRIMRADNGDLRSHYHLVRRHLEARADKDRVIRVPMSRVCTITTFSPRATSWFVNGDKLVRLPFRQGPQIMHDAAHLGLPAFVVFDGRVFDVLDCSQLASDYAWQTEIGRRHKTVPA